MIRFNTGLSAFIVEYINRNPGARFSEISSAARRRFSRRSSSDLVNRSTAAILFSMTEAGRLRRTGEARQYAYRVRASYRRG